jgi:hypothetical protein
MIVKTHSICIDVLSNIQRQAIKLHGLQLTSFLNQFDNAVRVKLAKLDEKLKKLERKVTYLEAGMVANPTSNQQRNSFDS